MHNSHDDAGVQTANGHRYTSPNAVMRLGSGGLPVAVRQVQSLQGGPWCQVVRPAGVTDVPAPPAFIVGATDPLN